MLSILKKEQPKTIIFLLLYFGWSLWSDVSLLFSYPSSMDYQLFISIGLSLPVFIGIILVLTVFDCLALWFLAQPRPIGFWVVLAAVLFAFAENMVSMIITLTYQELAKNAYILSRQAKGLSIRESDIDVMFSQTGIYSMLAYIVGIAVVIISLLIWKRSYFFDNQS